MICILIWLNVVFEIERRVRPKHNLRDKSTQPTTQTPLFLASFSSIPSHKPKANSLTLKSLEQFTHFSHAKHELTVEQHRSITHSSVVSHLLAPIPCAQHHHHHHQRLFLSLSSEIARFTFCFRFACFLS
jgi:hypothetical protein